MNETIWDLPLMVLGKEVVCQSLYELTLRTQILMNGLGMMGEEEGLCRGEGNRCSFIY